LKQRGIEGSESAQFEIQTHFPHQFRISGIASIVLVMHHINSDIYVHRRKPTVSPPASDGFHECGYTQEERESVKGPRKGAFSRYRGILRPLYVLLRMIQNRTRLPVNGAEPKSGSSMYAVSTSNSIRPFPDFLTLKMMMYFTGSPLKSRASIVKKLPLFPLCCGFRSGRLRIKPGSSLDISFRFGQNRRIFLSPFR